MSAPLDQPRRLLPELALTVAAVTVVVGFAALPDRGRSRIVVAEALVAMACGVSATVASIVRRRDRAWPGTRYLAVALGLLSVGALFTLLGAGSPPSERASLGDLVFLVFAVPILLAVREEFLAHFPPEMRREVWVDVALVTASLSVIAYLALRPAGADSSVSIATAVFAFLAAVQFASYAGLALWVPSKVHLSQFAILTTFGAATTAFGWQWVRGTFEAQQLPVDIAFSAGAIALAAFASWAPARWHAGPEGRASKWGRPALTTAAVAAALGALGFVATGQHSSAISTAQASWLIAALGLCVVLRIVANQIRSTQANDRVRAALEQKELALREADAALDRVREANETLRESEEHLRRVFETAVDGIVELDQKDVVVRANRAFCAMVGLPRETIEGEPWTALAAAVKGADDAFLSLPRTGQAQIHRDGQSLHLESRTSEVPIVPPRRLLFVRDVTAGRVADQTIRSLFQFLQDRDEDRTRLLRRTNSAIEAERNRIARDLHDGPVQGVSAASLSLEAALLMIKAGEIDRGLEVLQRIRRELSAEADGLRRLMSGLRPPLLEERGLIPALRETLARFAEDQGIESGFSTRGMDKVPEDIETLAYRVVQEALSNAGKHAGASRVEVHVETAANQLRVEITDDGAGFDTAQAREFLHTGRVGLASMRERVELANGSFLVHASLGKGTTIVATLPTDVIAVPELEPSQP